MQCTCTILSSVWHVWLCIIFPPYVVNSTILGKKKLLNKKLCFDFLYKFIWNISHSKKNWARYDQKCILFCMWSTQYSCQILMKLDFPQLIFKKFSNIKFHENVSNGSQVPCGQTDGQTWRSFHNFLNAPKNMKIKTEPSFCDMYGAENGISA